MKKIILITTLIFIGITLHSQTSLKMDNTTKYGSSIIKPTFINLSKLLICDMSTFKATMKAYKYSVATDRSSYIADNQVGSPYYTIQKSNDDVMMVFTRDDGFVSSFRSEIKKLSGVGTVKYESGYEVYYASFDSGGYTHNIKITIKENINGSSTVGIVKL